MIQHTEGMKDVARDILAALPRGARKASILTLSGDLGAGKTTFTQALAEELGVKGRVTSPTFGIMRSYDIPPCHPEQNVCHPELDSGSPRISSGNNTSKIPDHPLRQGSAGHKVRNDSKGRTFTTLVHIDAYRLEGREDLETLGWENLVANPKNLIVIEWPERISDSIPQSATHLSFEHIDENTRKVKVNP